jgi:hypothetical protein
MPKPSIMWSFNIAVVLAVLLSAASSLPGAPAAGVALAPGMVAAEFLFPQGGQSDWANVYIVVAIVVEALTLTLPVFVLWRLVTSRISK